MKDENIKLLIKNEFENGAGVTVLSKKYKVSANTINSWKKREKWRKKVAPKGNAPNSKKCTKNKTGANDKETQIKSDILNNVPKEKILQKFSVTERTYYNKVKSVREIQIQKSQSVLTKIADENYKDLKEQLLELENEKRKLKEKFLKIGLDDDETLKRINTRLKVLKEFEKEIYKGGQIVGSYRQAELETELENENIQKEKLEIEKSKLNTDINEDNKIEIKLVGI
jgi:putative pbsx phage terminase small subunit